MDFEQLEIERRNIEIYFRRISVSKLIKGLEYISDIKKKGSIGQCFYNDISEDIFMTASYKIYSNYTHDEIHNIYLKSIEDMTMSNDGTKNVFYLLSKYGEKTLVTDDKHPVCRYETMLNWWKSGIKVGQDIITTAFLASRDICNYEKTTFFAWPAVVRSNNERLRKILDLGMAENHFHLNGSTQIFPLSWICLMNNYEDIHNSLKKFDKKLDRDVFFDDCDKRYSWDRLIQVAAVIRWYLFGTIVGSDEDVSLDEISKYIVELVDEQYAVLNSKFGNMNDRINKTKFIYGKRIGEYKECFDYAVCNLLSDENNNCNRILSGERFFMYNCFRAIYQGEFKEIQSQLFYIYLEIKQAFRGELIQANDRRGFYNFQEYQKRKSFITKGKAQYDREQVVLSVVSSMESQAIKSLEARFAPGNSASKIKKSVRQYDDYINSYYRNASDRYLENSSSFRDCATEMNVFYVVHFIKEPDRTLITGNGISLKCRHYDLREKLHKSAKALADTLENDSSMRLRIKGIDAASSEVDCRPEVMATEFRYLRYLNPIGKTDNPFVCINPLSIKVTYHAGEDFNHIIDGLRAIDEANLFLNMQRNDRLGHALALGIDPVAYYNKRNNIVVLSKQDLLDDLTWFLYKCVLFDLPLVQSDRDIIYQKINILLDEIYQTNIKDYNNKFSFDDYINAWKLRGDSPELYRYGAFQNQDDFFINSYKNNQINKLVDNRIRDNQAVVLLYSAYHYNMEVRKKGEQIEKFEFTPTMIKSICELQYKMQFEISDKGIAIECNPTSNYVIGTFKRIDKHPILQFYNHSLETDSEILKKSAQLSVSINTDDQGVFDTSLVNEYTVMAAALEMIKDENGFQKYRPVKVYNWIDDIRKMGMEQSFSSF